MWLLSTGRKLAKCVNEWLPSGRKTRVLTHGTSSKANVSCKTQKSKVYSLVFKKKDDLRHQIEDLLVQRYNVPLTHYWPHIK